MKREFLKDLGIEDETIEKIMTEHGKTVQSLNSTITENETELTSLKEQLLERDNDIKELQANTEDEELKAKYSELQSKYDEDIETLNNQLAKKRLDGAITLELVNRKALNNKTVLPLIDMDTVKLTDEGVQGLAEQLDKIAEDNPFLFEQEIEDEPKKPSFSVGKNPAKSEATRTDALREALGIK